MMTTDLERRLRFGTNDDVISIFDAFNVHQPNIDLGDFFWYLSDVFTMGVQYGGRTAMCDRFAEPSWNMSHPEAGLATFAEEKGVHVDEYDSESLKNITYDFHKNYRQWTWQYCTEFGWFQEPNTFYPQRSQLLNSTYWLDYCKRIFGDSYTEPAIKYAHSYYGDTHMTGEHIYFVNSVEDPWQYAGMRYLTDPDGTQKKMKAGYVNCPDCAHCRDLKIPHDNDPQAVKDIQMDVKNTLVEWMNLTKVQQPAQAEDVVAFLQN